MILDFYNEAIKMILDFYNEAIKMISDFYNKEFTRVEDRSKIINLNRKRLEERLENAELSEDFEKEFDKLKLEYTPKKEFTSQKFENKYKEISIEGHEDTIRNRQIQPLSLYQKISRFCNFCG